MRRDELREILIKREGLEKRRLVPRDPPEEEEQEEGRQRDEGGSTFC